MKSTIAEFFSAARPWDGQWDDLRERSDSGFMGAAGSTMAVLEEAL